MCFSDGEPLPATTKEPYVGESIIGEPDCFRSPKGPTTGSTGFYLDTYGLTQEPALIAPMSDGLIAPMSDGEQIIWENLGAGYAQDAYSQVLPDPPPYVSLLPSDSPNETMMTVAKDATQARGTKYTWPHVLHIDLVKIDGFAQGIHPLRISCTTKLITLSLAVYGMLTPFPFDRGKMVSPFCHHACSYAYLIRLYQASLMHPSLLLWKVFEEGYYYQVLPYCLWGVIVCIWGVTTCIGSILYKLHLAQALSKHSEHVQPSPAWIWITKESHILFSTSSSHLIWRYTCF